MSQHRRLCAVVAVVTASAFLTVLAGCGSGGGASSSSNASSSSGSAVNTETVSAPAKPEPGKIRMGINPWLGYGPWFIADAKGWFAEEGLEVELVNIPEANQGNAAFVGGQVDVFNTVPHTALRIFQQEPETRIVLLEDISTTADAILGNDQTPTIKALKGKKVAYEEGSTSDILLHYALAKNGMSIDEIQRVPMSASNAGVAALAGKVNAAVTYEPYLTAALNEDKGFKLIFTAGEKPGLIGDVLLTKKAYLDEHPGQMAALARVWQRGVEFYKSNPKEAHEIITKAVGASAGELDSAFAGLEIYDIDENAKLLSGPYEATLQSIGEAAESAELLQSGWSDDGIIDPQFVKEAAEGQK